MKTLLLLASILHSVVAQSSPRAASICVPTECLIEDDCRCSSTDNPIADPNDPAPQLIALTLDQPVVSSFYSDYLVPLLFDRTNPDGNPTGATFFISHEYTDYVLVQKLYLRGYEIGVHSITKNIGSGYWKFATVEDFVEEFGGQREIISTFANVPIEDIGDKRKIDNYKQYTKTSLSLPVS